ETSGDLTIHADLSDIATFHCNDMVVDNQGRAYVGNFGFDLHAAQKGSFQPATLAIVDLDGTAQAGPADMYFPNGSVITDDGKTLVVAETFAGRLAEFDIAADGSLSNRRVWANLPEGITPDGIAMDIAGDIWVTCPSSGKVYLIEEGGAVKETLAPSQNPFACMLGGPDGKTLFVLTATDSHPDKAKTSRSGKLEVTRVAAGRGYAKP
ncbi:MAG: SMP-30/gluconolactonase/LRE family protein, partial [Alphaproteobacteria bacterium]